MAVEFKLKNRYSDFQSVQQDISLYEEENKQNLWINDAKYIHSNLKYKDKGIKPSLVYGELRYSCTQGGRKRLNRNCPFMIRFKPTKNLQYLEISKLNIEHNHDIDVNSYKPRARVISKPRTSHCRRVLKPKKETLSEREKYQKLNSIMQQSIALMCTDGMNTFQESCEKQTALLNCLRNGGKWNIVVTNPDPIIPPPSEFQDKKPKREINGETSVCKKPIKVI